jgi:hypothetical protein
MQFARKLEINRVKFLVKEIKKFKQSVTIIAALKFRVTGRRYLLLRAFYK